jgi:hypothetical protein
MKKTRIYKSQLRVVPLTGTQSGQWGISWSDAPYALCIYPLPTESYGAILPDSAAVWGLDGPMTVEEAWEDFDYRDEYELLD